MAPKPKRKKIIKVVLFVTALVPLALFSHLALLQYFKTLPLKPSPAPKTALTLHPELIYPIHQYQKLGSRYKWGTNDCSTFVTDYLRASGKPTFKRLVTADLYDTRTMRMQGFSETSEENLRPGDIIVFRYTGRFNTMQGHVGIVIDSGRDNQVIHNSLTHRGLKVESVSSFLKVAHRVADRQGDRKMIKFLTRSDYAVWEIGYKHRKSKATSTNF
jgi:hypothetical protein